MESHVAIVQGYCVALMFVSERRTAAHVPWNCELVRAAWIAASTRAAALTNERPASTAASRLPPLRTTCS